MQPPIIRLQEPFLQYLTRLYYWRNCRKPADTAKGMEGEARIWISRLVLCNGEFDLSRRLVPTTCADEAIGEAASSQRENGSGCWILKSSSDPDLPAGRQVHIGIAAGEPSFFLLQTIDASLKSRQWPRLALILGYKCFVRVLDPWIFRLVHTSEGSVTIRKAGRD